MDPKHEMQGVVRDLERLCAELSPDTSEFTVTKLKNHIERLKRLIHLLDVTGNE